MRISFSACKQAPAQPLVNFRGGVVNMDHFMPWRRKDKVLILMGATGTGKSRLSIDLASRFQAEIINSDKIQVYDGLDIVTNKVTEEECRGVPHHLLGVVDSDADFTANDFRQHATLAVESIVRRDRLPIIAGGSNSFIKALVNDEFRSRYACCFLWVDVSFPVLHSFVSDRVDKMVESGLVEEVRRFFNPNSDNYTRGVRRAIGLPEMDEFLRAEANVDDETRAALLAMAINKIKGNTSLLALNQLKNIRTLQKQMEWHMHRLDATEAFLKSGSESHEAWERLVARPSKAIVGNFLYEEDSSPSPSFLKIATASAVGAAAITTSATAVVAAGR
ncbi:Adenylate isopentenyltransferase [Heracleum sosnowskyi]|uniref:adenylate dimethylallyltransferase (ADP/ATP-dependent) n=1 Tax=Heracleum sosnowskyi TaxID=360622 RepID=A0AAD8GPB3_9APIA|nr:Adenylate isopentenyltransferase [Heracleum sosnowskyi]